MTGQKLSGAIVLDDTPGDRPAMLRLVLEQHDDEVRRWIGPLSDAERTALERQLNDALARAGVEIRRLVRAACARPKEA